MILTFLFDFWLWKRFCFLLELPVMLLFMSKPNLLTSFCPLHRKLKLHSYGGYFKFKREPGRYSKQVSLICYL